MANTQWLVLSRARLVRHPQWKVALKLTGALAFGIFHLNGTSLHNWQYLFIIEGSITVFIAFIAWFWLPKGPASAWFLTSDEQVFATQRIMQDNALFVTHEHGRDGIPKKRLTKRDIVETAKDWKLWFLLMFNICASVPSQAFSVFLPIVLQGLGYSSIHANLVFQTVDVVCTEADLAMLDVCTPFRVWCYRSLSFRP